MDESQFEKVVPEQEEQSSPGLLVNWRACLLLAVMLLGVLATPLAVFYRWYAERSATELVGQSGRADAINRIAFIRPDGQLATVSPDGRDVSQLTDEPHGFQFPAWSPDGRQLAAAGRGRVLVLGHHDQQESGGDPLQLYDNQEEAPFYLYWSPDSRQVAFLASHPEGIALHVAQSQEGGANSRLLGLGEPFYWQWAPAADQIFIHSGGSGADARLEMIDLAGSTTADDFGAAGLFQTPGISHDGRYKAYAALDDSGLSRLVVQDSGGELKQYETHLGQLALAWSPVADLLAYRSPRPDGRFNGGALRLLDPRTGESSVLSGQDVLAFFWSPDGRTVAFFSWPRAFGDVRVAEASKSSIRARPQRQHDELRLELWAVDIASRQQRQLLQFTPTVLFMRQFLPYFDQYALSHRIWSPNSDALVLPVFEEGRSQIAVVPLGEGDAALIADGQSAFWSHQ